MYEANCKVLERPRRCTRSHTNIQSAIHLLHKCCSLQNDLSVVVVECPVRANYKVNLSTCATPRHIGTAHTRGGTLGLTHIKRARERERERERESEELSLLIYFFSSSYWLCC